MFVFLDTLLGEGVELTTDQKLLIRSSRGDRAAFAEFYDRHAAAVLRYAFALAHDPDDAQDLLQETFITTWSKIGVIKLATRSALPWLLVTCRNHAMNLRRSKGVRATVPIDASREPAVAGDHLGRLEREEESRWVIATIQLADPTDARIVEACILGDMSYRDASHQIGLSEQAVAKRVNRLRSRLTQLRSARDGEGS